MQEAGTLSKPNYLKTKVGSGFECLPYTLMGEFDEICQQYRNTIFSNSLHIDFEWLTSLPGIQIFWTSIVLHSYYTLEDIQGTVDDEWRETDPSVRNWKGL